MATMTSSRRVCELHSGLQVVQEVFSIQVGLGPLLKGMDAGVASPLIISGVPQVPS